MNKKYFDEMVSLGFTVEGVAGGLYVALKDYLLNGEKRVIGINTESITIYRGTLADFDYGDYDNTIWVDEHRDKVKDIFDTNIASEILRVCDLFEKVYR